MEYIEQFINGMNVIVRDIRRDDINTIVDYWHNSDPEFLKSIGVDVSKIVSREITESIFIKSLPENRGEKDRAVLVFSIDGSVAGYTNVNFNESGEAYAHVHLIDQMYRNKGVIPSLFFKVINIYYKKFGVRRLLLQTNVNNKPINNLLYKQDLEFIRTGYFEKPDGMGAAGHYNLFHCPEEFAERQADRS